MAYFDTLSARRRPEPTGDVASVIAKARVDGEPISDTATMGYCVITATAGHDTTWSSTDGAIWGLAQNPEQFRKLPICYRMR